MIVFVQVDSGLQQDRRPGPTAALRSKYDPDIPGVALTIHNETGARVQVRWIDGNGRVLEVGPRHETGFIYAEVRGDGRRSLYQATGDVFAGICLLFCTACAVVGVVVQLRKFKRRKVSKSDAAAGSAAKA